MLIKAISTVTGVRATDGGLTIVLEMLDGSEQLVRVLIPVGAIQQTMALLSKAAAEAAELRAARSGS